MRWSVRMRNQRLLLLLTLINLVLLAGLVLDRVTPVWAQQGTAQMLRGRGLEIVDDRGRLRATIGVLPSTTVDSKRYPESVLLRLIDPKSGPGLKLGAVRKGRAYRLTNRADRVGW